MFVKLCLFAVLATLAMSAPVDLAPKDKAVTLEDSWSDFKNTEGKKYESPEEEQRRFQIFKSNFERIQAHNKKYDAGEVSYKQGINQFADLTHEEFSATYLMHVSPSPPEEFKEPHKKLSGAH